MEVLNRFFGGYICRGVVLAVGVASLFMYKRQQLHPLLGVVSYGVTSLGLFEIITHYLKQEEEIAEDPEYQERMEEFYRLKPLLEMRLREQSELERECQKFIEQRNILEDWTNESKILDQRILRLQHQLIKEQEQLTESEDRGCTEDGQVPSTSESYEDGKCLQDELQKSEKTEDGICKNEQKHSEQTTAFENIDAAEEATEV